MQLKTLEDLSNISKQSTHLSIYLNRADSLFVEDANLELHLISRKLHDKACDITDTENVLHKVETGEFRAASLKAYRNTGVPLVTITVAEINSAIRGQKLDNLLS